MPGQKKQKYRNSKPPVSSVAVGQNNQRAYTGETYIKGNSYRDLSTVCFTPSLGRIPVRVVQAWNNLIKPMNQKYTHIFLVEDEVGKAYEKMIDIIRTNPELRKFKYVLTMEEDNVPPPDGLLKLYEDIEKYDAVGGLYWTKGDDVRISKPMCYGRTDVFPRDFIPWLPPVNTVSTCHGLGQGFTLYRMKMFLDEKFQRPIFKTEQSYDREKGIRLFTQDLAFFEKASLLGYKFACSTNVLVGHYDWANDKMY